MNYNARVTMKYRVVVVGVSTGGLNALKKLLLPLPMGFPCPIIIVQHLSPQSDSFWISHLDEMTKLKIKEAEDKEPIAPGYVYIAPPDYHLLIEADETFSLSHDHKVNFARPSIDVLFESAADVYREKLIGIVLTGASSDGAKGLQMIEENGGLAIVQDPQTAEAQMMPKSAITFVKNPYVNSLEKIVGLLIQQCL